MTKNKCNSCKRDEEEIKQFLQEREKADSASGARVYKLNQEIRELEQGIPSVIAGLRLLL